MKRSKTGMGLEGNCGPAVCMITVSKLWTLTTPGAWDAVQPTLLLRVMPTTLVRLTSHYTRSGLPTCTSKLLARACVPQHYSEASSTMHCHQLHTLGKSRRRRSNLFARRHCLPLSRAARSSLQLQLRHHVVRHGCQVVVRPPAPVRLRTGVIDARWPRRSDVLSEVRLIHHLQRHDAHEA
jgi:hypothetical protein